MNGYPLDQRAGRQGADAGEEGYITTKKEILLAHCARSIKG